MMKKKVDRKIRLKKIKLIFATLILLLAIFFILVTQTSIFNVKKILVNGNNEVSNDKISLASGIIMGENIFKADTKNAKENLLLHPYIKDVNIKRKIPDKIIININEREELACIKYMNSYVYVGLDGLILDILKEKKGNKVPLIEGLSIESPSIGSKAIYGKKNKKENNQIEEFFQVISKQGLKEQAKTITFNKNNIDIVTNTGINIAFGSPFNIEYKVKFLLETLKDLKGKNIKAKNIYLNKGNDIIVEIVDS